jgi:hypothetical protein
MTFRSARREALSQPTIGKSFKSTVYPPEAKSFFHHFNVWNSWPLGWTLTAISHHPTTFLFVVVLFEPLAKLRTIPKVYKIYNFHDFALLQLYTGKVGREKPQVLLHLGLPHQFYADLFL